MKIYGDEKTNLTLTDKAFEVYSNTDPLKIIEEDDGTYSMTGCIERFGMTEDQVNAVLESLYVNEEAQEIINNGLYDAAVALMDDDIREELHNRLALCTDEEFLSAYMEAHKEKYGIDFVV